MWQSATRSARERRPPLALRGQWRASLRPASPGPLQRRTRRHGDTLCACTPRLSSSTSRFAKMTRRLPAPPPRRSLARRIISGGIVVAPLPQHSCSCSIKAIKIIIVNCAAKMGRGDSKARCTRPPALHVGFSPIFRTHPQSVPACNNRKRARACLCGSYQGLDQLISQSQLLRRSVDLVKMQTYMHILSDLKQPLTETKASFPLLMTARSMSRRCSQSRLAHWEERAQAHSAVTSAATSLVRHGTQQPVPPFLVTYAVIVQSSLV